MIKKLFFALLGIYLLVLVGFYLLQERIIFLSDKLDTNFKFESSIEFEEVNLKAFDTSNINALHFKTKNPKGILIYFHGNKGSLKRWGKMLSPYTAYNYDVFVMDYRGYGKSSGKRDETAMYNDAQVAYDYVKTKFKEDDIVIYGRSLGATFATFVASQNNPKQLVLEAPFYSLLHTIQQKFPVLPYRILLKYKFETFRYIKNVQTPTVIFHGENDGLIPIQSGKKLYEASQKDNTQFVSIANATHHNIGSFDVYKNKLNQILN